MTLTEKLTAYERLMRLDKPIGILLLLWPTLWAIWLSAPGVVRLDVLLIFIVGTLLMRSAGCIVNDFADRKIDPHVERTRDRPLATGLVGPREALVIAGILMVCAFVLVLKLHRLVIYLSLFAIAITIIYPFLKRFFAFPQAVLGIAFSLGVPMAFAAQRGYFPALSWVLMAAVFFWIIAYDTEYAMVDRDDDIKLGVHSSAILLGRFDVAAIMACQSVFLAIMVGIGVWQRLGAIYYVSLALAAVFVGLQYSLIRERNREKCFQAFRLNGWLGGLIFVGLLLDMQYRVNVLP